MPTLQPQIKLSTPSVSSRASLNFHIPVQNAGTKTLSPPLIQLKWPKKNRCKSTWGRWFVWCWLMVADTKGSFIATIGRGILWSTVLPVSILMGPSSTRAFLSCHTKMSPRSLSNWVEVGEWFCRVLVAEAHDIMYISQIILVLLTDSYLTRILSPCVWVLKSYHCSNYFGAG